MVKQHYEATEEVTDEATAATHPPKHYPTNCHCWSQEEMGNVLSTGEPPPGNRKDREKDIFCLALEKSGTNPNCFLLT